VKLRIWAASSA